MAELLSSLPFTIPGGDIRVRRMHCVAGLLQPAATHHRAVPAGGPPGKFAKFMRAELAKWGKSVKESARVEQWFS